LVEAIPYKITVVLTDNGIQFADLPKNRKGPTAMLRGHPFLRACKHHGIEHRLTKPNHPWTTDIIDKNFFADLRSRWEVKVYRGMSDIAIHLTAASLASGTPCQ
jgi:transposase InsO family protein